MSDRQIFFILGVALMFIIPIAFIPTGENGEWEFVDYFHASITVPFVVFLFYRYYKKI